jgi:hypothetical protein
MPYASLAVSWGERDPAGGSAGGGVVLVSLRGLSGFFAGAASGRGDPPLPLPVGFGVGAGVEREEAGVGEGEEGAFSQPVSEGSGVGFAARDEPEGALVASQNAATAMIAKTAVNRITFRQSNDRRRSGCQSDACSESCLEEPLPRPEDPACPSGKSDARHDIGPNIRLTVIYWEGKEAE